MRIEEVDTEIRRITLSVVGVSSTKEGVKFSSRIAISNGIRSNLDIVVKFYGLEMGKVGNLLGMIEDGDFIVLPSKSSTEEFDKLKKGLKKDQVGMIEWMKKVVRLNPTEFISYMKNSPESGRGRLPEATNLSVRADGDKLIVSDGNIDKAYSIRDTSLSAEGWAERINKVLKEDPSKARDLIAQVASEEGDSATLLKKIQVKAQDLSQLAKRAIGAGQGIRPVAGSQVLKDLDRAPRELGI